MWNAQMITVKNMLDTAMPDYFVGGIMSNIARQYSLLTFAFPINRVSTGFDFYKTCLHQVLSAKKWGKE